MTVSFSTLWDNFPEDPIIHKDPKTGKDIFDNHCAINLSQCLNNSGIQIKAFAGTLCWSCPSGRIHIIRAEEMAAWLKLKPFIGCPAWETYTGSNFVEKLDGRTGIIYLADYWRRGSSESSRTGDHIDLWNGTRMTDLSSYFRAQWGLSWDGYLSDYRKAKKVIFWPIS
ncbi:hypothetical protein BTA51_19580 [Hahella sp. CCB-MM4]|uniref:type VI secretion system amidase effector protein Tae4 n=1 Tax=Hahella sp. (strain CCB-MM4) TaxID=1926491 RepID=UPI000B9C052F|nr:type VI secretion system amidase effector protein Tae4 [Hahella sp. CCB-MM4]OZG71824.1 hypothetical protein BTA51_19580 [Hahella sp. CCB-MM4]